jgi:uncharacterized protein YxjI
LREKMFSIGDVSWIENGVGQRAYKVDGKALRVRETLVIEDASGNEVAQSRRRRSASATPTASRSIRGRTSGSCSRSPCASTA